jgi:arylsulfatase A-like enzyme
VSITLQSNFSILEIDDAVGQMVDALKKNGIEDQTLIYFTSDHGSHIDKGTEGGSNYPFKGNYLHIIISLDI